MFLSPRVVGPVSTGRREKSDHTTVDEAKHAFAHHPSRAEFEALIYVDGAPQWVGTADRLGRVEWHAWKV
jgi:hypothetical protein